MRAGQRDRRSLAGIRTVKAGSPSSLRAQRKASRALGSLERPQAQATQTLQRVSLRTDRDAHLGLGGVQVTELFELHRQAMTQGAFQTQFVEEFFRPIKGVGGDLLLGLEELREATLDFVFGEQGILQQNRVGTGVPCNVLPKTSLRPSQNA